MQRSSMSSMPGACAIAKQGMRLMDQAVLFQWRPIIQRPSRDSNSCSRNIPYVKYGGLKFLEAAHVKDLLSSPEMGGKPAQPGGGVSACSNCCLAWGRAIACALLRTPRGIA